jgi:glucan endo-1,3-beta-D-glucosidase
MIDVAQEVQRLSRHQCLGRNVSYSSSALHFVQHVSFYFHCLSFSISSNARRPETLQLSPHYKMHLVPLIFYLLTLIPPGTAYWRGVNIKSNLADGSSCKSASDYLSAYQTLKTFPNSINAARLYSSWSCNTLSNALPNAISTDTKLLAGVSLTNFDNEKGALLAAVKQYGFGWMVGVSVGSEDLYRGTVSPAALAGMIYDVRGMLSEVSGYSDEVRVGHVDTTNAWTNASNSAVIRACDFVGTDIYPYFQTLQDNDISNAENLFWNGVKQVRDAVSNVGGGASVWVTETGWPVSGPTKGKAVPGTDNAGTYWKEVACSAFGSLNAFWFTLQDWSAVPSFAIIGQDGERLYNLTC